MIVGALDARWDITYRWSLVGFGGAGSTANEIGDFGEERAKWAGGAIVPHPMARAASGHESGAGQSLGLAGKF